MPDEKDRRHSTETLQCLNGAAVEFFRTFSPWWLDTAVIIPGRLPFPLTIASLYEVCHRMDVDSALGGGNGLGGLPNALERA